MKMKKFEFEGLSCFTVKLKLGRSPLSDSQQCLILESDPNPGYYGLHDFPPNKKHVNDWHLFIPLKHHFSCFQEVIIRNAHFLRDRFNLDIRVSPGQISLHNETHHCIRVNPENIEHLALLNEEIKELGISLMNDQKIEPYESFVSYNKYVEFMQIQEEVFQDSVNHHRYYFQVPIHLTFDKLLDGMEQIKNSYDFNVFEYFQLFIFRKDSVQDFIGIYSKHFDDSRLIEMKERINQTFHF